MTRTQKDFAALLGLAALCLMGLAGGASAQTAVVTDTYTDTAGTLLTAHTPNVGGSYVAQSGATGAMQITASGTVRPTDGTNAIFSPSGTPSSTSYDVQSDILYKNAVSGVYYAGISSHASLSNRAEYLFRWDNSLGGYDFFYFGTNAAVVASTTSIAAPAAVPFTVASGGVRAGIRTQVSGANLIVKLYVAPLGQDAFTGANSTLVYTYTDTTGGLPIGLGQIQANEPSANAVDGGGFQFDNFSVTNGTALPPPVVVPVTDADWYFSPYNTYSDGAGALSTNNIHAGSTYALSNNVNSYNVLGFSGTTASLSVDVSALTAISATVYPVIAYSVDNGPLTYVQLNSSSTVVNCTPTALSAGNHTLRDWFDFVTTNSRPDRWNIPAESVKFTGATIDNGSTTVALTGTDAPLSGNLIIYWDSIGESQWDTGFGTGDTLLSFVGGVADALNCNYGNVAFGSEQWVGGATSNVPAFPSSWNYYSSGRSRLVGGLLSPVPNYIICGLGENDGLHANAAASVTSASQAWYASARAAAPTSAIVQFVPFSGLEAAPLLAAFQGYQGGAGNVTTLTTPYGGTIYKGTLDPKCYLINLGPVAAVGFGPALGGATRTSIDMVHPSKEAEKKFTAMMSQAIQQATTPTTPRQSGEVGRGR